MTTPKKKFNAIVIDDERTRNKTYSNALKAKYNVSFINETSDIDRKQIMRYDILVIDVWLGNHITAFRIIDEYGLTLPTVLVSGKWIEDGEPSDMILSVPSYKNIIKVVSWNSFNRGDSNTKIGEEIFYQFCKYKNFLLSNDVEKFSLLHLSDLQFGGHEADAALNDNYRIARFLKEKEIRPEIIVITGDIADKGKEVEYKAAYEWLKALIKEMWDIDGDIENEILKRVIMVPGNHDYDLSISASDYYEFSFKAEKIGTFEEKTNVNVNQKVGFYNFIRFAYRFSKDISYFNYTDKAIHINETFKDWGIRFITLNSVYNINSDNCENRFGKYYCDLSEIDDNALSPGTSMNDGLCNILISHNPAENFMLFENGDKSRARLQTVIEDNKINIIMSGHTHDFKTASRLNDGGGKHCHSAVCISAPCARLSAASRVEDAPRGFNIIEFSRKEGFVEKIKPRYFSLKRALITEITDYEEEFTI